MSPSTRPRHVRLVELRLPVQRDRCEEDPVGRDLADHTVMACPYAGFWGVVPTSNAASTTRCGGPTKPGCDAVTGEIGWAVAKNWLT